MSDLAVSDDLKGPVFKPDLSGGLGSALAGQMEKMLPEAIKTGEEDRALKRRVATSVISEIDRAAERRKEIPKPPPPQPQQPPQFNPTSTVQQWGSLAMGFAMLGSAFTKRPAINALNAAAGVMNAYHDGDQEAYKRNFDHWKATTDYALKMYEYQREAYKDALSDIDSDVNGAMQKLRVVSSAFGDDSLAELAKIGNAAGVIQKLKMSDFTAEQTRLQTEQLARHGQIMQQAWEAQDRLQKNPNDIEAQQALRSAVEKIAIEKRLTQAGTPAGDKEMRAADLRASLTKEWQAKNPGKEIPASVQAQIEAQSEASVSGRAASAAGSRSTAVNERVEAEVQKFMMANPTATPEQIDDARWQAQVRATRELEGAAHQPRSAQGLFTARYMEENPNAGAADIAEANATYRRLQASESAFAGGVMGRNLQSLNTVAGHILDIYDYGEALRNGDIPRANQIANRFAVETGQPEVTNFRAGRDIMAGEIVRLLTTTGGTEEDRRKMESNLADSFSPAQLSGSVGVFKTMVKDRLDAMEQNYARNDPARRKEFETNMLTTKAKQVFGVGAATPSATGAAPREVPAGLPDPSGRPDGTTAKDKSGKVVAIVRGGKWVAP